MTRAATRRPPRLALIDLDGTLVDTLADLARAVDAACGAVQAPAPGEARVRAWIGDGVERLMRRALAAQSASEPDPACLARALDAFEAHYARGSGEASRLYPGVVEGLGFLAGCATALVCVTNKPARFTEPLLARLGLRERFRLVLSGDSLARRKPDPLPHAHAARVLGIDLRDAIAIGDSRNDALAARAAGVPFVAVTYGYGGDVRALEPDLALDSLADLRRHYSPG